ncbi:MAG: sensor domain-containing diguanylate cyclase [Pseudomonadota bacterium]
MDSLLTHLADSVSSAQTLEELTRPLLELLEAVTGLESTYLTAIDLDGEVQRILYARNARQMQIPEGLTMPWGDTLCKRALDEGRTCTDDVAGIWGDSEAARALGIRTYVSTPVTMSDGELYGTLCAASATRASLGGDAERVLKMFGTLIAQHIERDRLVTQLRATNAELAMSALTDAVTGLANRRAFFAEGARIMARAARAGSGVLVAFIDLDGFKAINDRLGHDVGDQLLTEVGRRIVAGRRAGDLVARFGGDEFVMMAEVPADHMERACRAVREGLETSTRGTYQLRDQRVDYAGASVGVAAANGPGADLDQLVKQADEAMYRNKQARRTATLPRREKAGTRPMLRAVAAAVG